MPPVLEETLVSSHKARTLASHRSASKGGSPEYATASDSSFKTAVSQSRSHSRSLPSQPPPSQEKAWSVMSLSPLSPSTAASSSSATAAAPSRSPSPTHVGEERQRHDGDGGASGGGTQASALLAKLRSRTDSIAAKQRQREERRSSSASSASAPRPLQQLLRSRASLSSDRADRHAQGRTQEEEEEKEKEKERERKREARSVCSAAQTASAIAARRTRRQAASPPVTATRRRSLTRSRSRSNASTERDHADHRRAQGAAHAWQQALIDTQLKLRELQEQQQEQRAKGSSEANAVAGGGGADHHHHCQHTADPLTKHSDAMGEDEDSSSGGSAQRLAQHLQLVEQEWARREEHFQQAKRALEEELVGRFEAMHQQSLEERRRAAAEDGGGGGGEAEQWQRFLREHFAAAYDGILAKEAALHSELERRVVEQVAIFTEEYKRVLDKDFEERCRAMESRVAERDRKWVSILAEERKRLQGSSGGGEGEERERQRRQEDIVLGAVGEAMREVTALREELMRSHEQQQEKLMRVFMEQRDSLNERHAEALRQQTSRVEAMQKEFAASVMGCQAEVDELHAQLAAKDVEIHKLTGALADCRRALGDEDPHSFSARCAHIREEVSQHWQVLLDEQRQEHSAVLRALSDEYNSRVEALRAEQQKHLAELSRSSRHQLAEGRRIADEQWSAKLAEYKRETLAQVDKMKSWEGVNRELKQEVKRLYQALDQLRESHEGRVSRATAEVEDAWRAKLQEAQERHEQLLAAAVLRQQASVPRDEHQSVLQELQSAKLRLVEMAAATATSTAAQVSEAERAWTGKLQEQAARHRGALEALRQLYEGRLSAWQETLSTREADWHRQSQESIAQLREQMQQQLEQERASCSAVVAAAHSAAEDRVRAFAQESERAWERKREGFETFMREREARVMQRDDELRLKEVRLKSDLQEALSLEVHQQREALLAERAKDEAALATAKEALEEHKRQYGFRLQRSYEEKFFRAKQQLRGQQAAMCAEILAATEARENVILEAKDEETAILVRYYTERLARQAASQRAFEEAMEERVRDALRREAVALEEQREALLKQGSDLQRQLSSAGEAACRELLDAHMAEVERVYASHAEERNESWRSLQEYVLQRTWQVDEQQHTFEANLRLHCEQLVKDERHRAADAVEDLRRSQSERIERLKTEHEAEREKAVSLLMERHEEDQRRWQLRIDALTRELEAQRQMYKAKHEAAGNEHRQQLQQQQDALEKAYHARLTALEDSLHHQTQEVRSACEARMRLAAEKESELRAQFACDLVAVERRYMAKNDVIQQELQQHFDEQLATLRSALQAKSESLVELEEAQEAAVRAQVEAAVADMEQRYGAFAEQLQRQRREREEAIAALQQQVQERLQSLLLSLEAAEGEQRLHAIDQQTDALRRLLEAGGAEARASTTPNPFRRNAVGNASHVHSLSPVNLLTLPPPPPPQRQQQQSSERAAAAMTEPTTTTTTAAMTIPFMGTQFIAVSPSAVDAPPPARAVLTPRSVNNYAPPTAANDKLRREAGSASANGLSAFLATEAAWGRLCELQSVLETPAEEQAQFREKLKRCWAQQSGPGSAPTAVRQALQREVSRLEDQLPLLEAFVRRQFLLERQQTEGYLGGEEEAAGSAAGVLNDEVERLTEELRAAVPQHEKRFGQTFVFCGRRLMEQLC